jgi:hypothetical protein
MLATDTLSPSQAKRQRRIERRCIVAVVEALHSGRISARSADVFLRLDPDQQAAELDRRLSAARERERRNRLAAEAIRMYLNGLGGQRPDLHQLVGVLKAALL